MLQDWYLWIKAVHIMAVISWMAAMFYLPRLYVYHVETTEHGEASSDTFAVMERKLIKAIMTPAMIVTWLAGLLLAFSGIVDVASIWFAIKLLGVLALSGFHGWCAAERKRLLEGQRRSGRFYRLANEVPAVLMIIVVLMVVLKPA